MDELLDVSDREGRRKEPSQGSPRRRRGFFGFLAGLLGGEGDEEGFDRPDGDSRRREPDQPSDSRNARRADRRRDEDGGFDWD